MTDVIRLTGDPADEAVWQRAAELLAAGRVVAFPTETVYGLGANASMPGAIRRLNHVKRRPEGRPYTQLLADPADALRHAAYVPLLARPLIRRYWPGPLTLVLSAAQGGTIGLRVPACNAAREIVRRAGVPVAAPSANPSGLPPAATADHVLAYFDGLIDLIVDGGPAQLPESSAVVAFENGGWKMLREGVIDSDTVARVARATIVFVCTGNTCRSPMAEAFCRKHLALRMGVPVDELSGRGYTVVSAGTSALRDVAASPEAIAAARERGCDLAQHGARVFDAAMAAGAELILVMSRLHREQVLAAAPDAADRVELLSRAGWDIADPLGGTAVRFAQCADEIEEAVEDLVKTI